MDKVYSLGVDIGSTTVKTVILDDGKIIWSKYQRHFSKVRETAAEQVKRTIPTLTALSSLAVRTQR